MIRHGEWWLDPKNVLQGEFFHPREHEKLIFTDASNAGWGAHLDHDSTGRGLVSHRKTPTYQPFRNEGSFPGPTFLQTHLQEQSRTHCVCEVDRGDQFVLSERSSYGLWGLHLELTCGQKFVETTFTGLQRLPGFGTRNKRL